MKWLSQERTERILRWLLFTFLISVFPIALRYLFLGLDGKPRGYPDLVGNGELFLIACSLASAAVGDIVARRKERETVNIVCLMLGFSGVILLLFSAGLWGYSSSTDQPETVARMSSVLFLVSAITGLWTKVLE